MKKPLIITFLLLIFCLSAFSQDTIGVYSGTNDLILVKKPYSMTPASNSVRIVWQTPENSPLTSIVKYGTTEETVNTIIGEDGWLIEGEGYMHEVTLKGLEPFTEYYYRVSDGENTSAEINKTKTAPLNGTDFRLMSISDTHDNSGKLWEMISKRAALDSIDMTVFIGDCVTRGDQREPWDSGFFIPGEPLLSKCPFLNSMGNHDTNHGPTKYYDYFSLPVHAENDDPPESYYSIIYGDVKIITLNLTEDEYSPAFNDTSQQYIWLEKEIKNSESKWIFVVTHVNLLSTGMHSQWSANQKKYILPLLEKYVSEGKRILVIGGHEHNFEHLYKNGINHIRPGCANIMRRNQYTIADSPYSQYFKNTAGYSTFDISENGNIVSIQSRDSSGVVFYKLKLDARDNLKPHMFITEPDGLYDSTNTSYNIRWEDSDPDDNAKISLYYTPDSLKADNGILITDTISENNPDKYFKWDINKIAPGSYHIYAIISDSINQPDTVFSTGKITIIHDSEIPPSVLNLEGKYSDNKIIFNWENPDEIIKYEKILADFEKGTDDFNGGTSGLYVSKDTLELIYQDSSGQYLRINYQIFAGGSQYAGIRKFALPFDLRKADNLSFEYKGDSTDNLLQIIIRQDNDRNRIADDWWCSGTFKIFDENWQQIIINLDSLKTYPKHPNSKPYFDGENIYSLEFIISANELSSGHIDIDNIRITGESQLFHDFRNAGLYRRNDIYPDFWGDGDLIYLGKEETCIDSTIELNKRYYYTLFTSDYSSNYSVPDQSAIWESPFITGTNQFSVKENKILSQNYPNPFSQTTTIEFEILKSQKVKVDIYNMSGIKITSLLNGFYNAGNHSIIFNPSLYGMSSQGIYFYKIETEEFTDFKKMLFKL